MLDVWRIAVKLRAVDQHFFNDKDGVAFLNRALSFVTQGNPPANQMLVFRMLSNAFILSWGERLMTTHISDIIDAVLLCDYKSNKNIQIAIATLLLNYAVVFTKKPDIEGKSRITTALAALLGSTLDGEATFRLLVCMGTLIHSDDEAIAIAKSLDLHEVVSKLQSDAYPEKVKQCASCISTIL